LLCIETLQDFSMAGSLRVADRQQFTGNPCSRSGYKVVAARFKASLSNVAVAWTTGITRS